MQAGAFPTEFLQFPMNLSEQEAFAFLGRLFPGGMKDPALIAELCPEGWGSSPLLFACYHPSPEVRYAESLEFSRNMKNLGLTLSRRKGEVTQAPPEEPEPTFEEFLAKNPLENLEVSAEQAIDEPAELLGLCLWDVFSDNHEVIAADGRVVDLGSFRGSAGVIADFFEGSNDREEKSEDGMWSGWDGGDYMRFYMGSWGLARRADLSPVYQLIFRRLKSLGADWRYSFPRLHLIDFGSREEDPGTDYDPSVALAKEAERKARAEELRQMRRKMDRDTLAAKREARRNEPPATVLAYQEIYRKFPPGWPPDPYPEESEI
jgi:hypothetical protein